MHIFVRQEKPWTILFTDVHLFLFLKNAYSNSVYKTIAVIFVLKSQSSPSQQYFGIQDIGLFF